MSYSYDKERPYVFTDEGQRKVLAVFRKAQDVCAIAGVVRCDKLLLECRGGDSFQHLAIIDRCEEMSLIRKVPSPNRPTQWTVYELVGAV